MKINLFKSQSKQVNQFITIVIAFMFISSSIQINMKTQSLKQKKDVFSKLSTSSKLANYETQPLELNEKSNHMENSTQLKNVSSSFSDVSFLEVSHKSQINALDYSKSHGPFIPKSRKSIKEMTQKSQKLKRVGNNKNDYISDNPDLISACEKEFTGKDYNYCISSEFYKKVMDCESTCEINNSVLLMINIIPISVALKQNKTITNLIINHCYLTDKKLKPILYALILENNITTLNLYHNSIELNGDLLHLLIKVLQNPYNKIENLDLGYNYISDHAIKEIQKASKLKSFKFEHNDSYYSNHSNNYRDENKIKEFNWE